MSFLNKELDKCNTYDIIGVEIDKSGTYVLDKEEA